MNPILEKRFFKIFYRLGTAQILGILAQLLSALPIFILTIFLARKKGLASVADLTFLVAISAVIFTVFTGGLRSRLLIERFNFYSKSDYFYLRLIKTILMSLLIISFGVYFSLSLTFSATIALFRAGDAASDLILAIDQVALVSGKQLYKYITVSTIKILALIISFIVYQNVCCWDLFFLIFISSGIYCLYAWGELFLRIKIEKKLVVTDVKRLIYLAKTSMVFLSAQLFCAVTTTLPRYLLAFEHEKEIAGAAATALSSCTLIGMVFYSVWLRWGPELGKNNLARKNIVSFALENTIILIFILLSISLFGRLAFRFVFNISSGEQIDVAFSTAISCGFFYYSITLANVFKSTLYPYIESLIYLIGVCCMLGLTLLSKFISIQEVILISSVLMFVSVSLFSIILFGWNIKASD